MPKKVSPAQKTQAPVNTPPSLPEPKQSVDIKSWIRKDTHEDPRINSLMRIIRWQGRFIVIILLLLIIAVVLPLLDINLVIPNQKALQTAPPIELNDIGYNALVYQDSKELRHGSIVTKPTIEMLGQIYDGVEVQKQWPDITFLVNNANVPITGPNAQFKINLNLQPGPNIIETSFRIDGVLYNRQQRVINYEPKKMVPIATSTTNTNETVSTQATVSTGR